MPPLVRYKYPIIGHTYDYYTNSEEFFKKCREEYGDVFSLYIWGEVKTFVGKEHMQEVLTRDDSFDFTQAFERILPLNAMLKNLIKFENSSNKILKEYVINKLRFYTERMQKCLNSATQKHIGDCDEPKVIHDIYSMMTKIISNPISNIFIGEEESKYEEIISTFSEFTTDAVYILRIPPLLDFIFPGLQYYINSTMLKLGIYNPAVKHQEVLIKHIKKQVTKRLQEKEKYGDSWKRPDDFIQDILENWFDPKNIKYEELADVMCLYIFVSIHTTSNSCTHAIMNLASRPEYAQELYEEQLEVQKEADENGILPFEALNNMKKLDSFVRESLRLSEGVITIPHVTLKDSTFSNGLQVPKGRPVFLYTDDVYRDESLQGPNPKSFEPFRHVDTNSSASKIGKNYVIFGGGKHACPGRQLAVNEIKFFLHNVILRYNLRTESGKIEGPKIVGPMKLPSNSGIIFEKRK
ncbi:hypothetical protein RclHR1_16090004 [Rhizophagus clarus]|nr:hypothetical protein RclHR1_16090004 [Rhizophagus clarus]